MFKLPFHINDTNVQALLVTSRFQIPALQRPYAWTEPQARDVLSDLQPMLTHLEDDGEIPYHFFGMIVSLNKAGTFQLIDGQQRLTTLTTLIAVIWRRFDELSSECRTIASNFDPATEAHLNEVATAADGMATSLYNDLWHNLGFQGGNKVQHEPRLLVSPEIQEMYMAVLTGRWDTEDWDFDDLARPARNLYDIANVFDDEFVAPPGFSDLEPLQKYKHLERVYKVVGQGLVIVHMTTSGASSGYDLFESLNATGVSLNELDLVKVWMLSVFAENQKDDSQIAKKMASLSNDDINEQRGFFHDFCVLRSTLSSHDGAELFKVSRDDVSKNEKQLSMKARKYVFKDESAGGVGGVLSLVERIEQEVSLMLEMYPVWSKLKRGHAASGERTPDYFVNCNEHLRIRASLGHLLDVMGFQQGYPFMMHWAYRFKDDPKLFGDIISLFERFFFRYRVICGRGEKRVRAALYEVSRHIESAADPTTDSVSDILKKYIDSEASDALFSTKLPLKLGYGGAGLNNRTKYFFYRLALHTWMPPYLGDDGHHIVLDRHANGATWTLEHIFPQNPTGGGGGLADPELLHTLGNLCLLNPSINTSMSNHDFAGKKAVAAQKQAEGKLIVVPDSAAIFYGDLATWSDDEILKREGALINKALAVFGF